MRDNALSSKYADPQTVYTQGEVVFTSTAGTVTEGVATMDVPQNLPYRRLYIAFGGVITGIGVSDPTSDDYSPELAGQLTISNGGQETYNQRFYNNPQARNLLLSAGGVYRTRGPWFPCELSRAPIVANVFPKLPFLAGANDRVFTLVTRRSDPPAFDHLLATCSPIHLNVTGDKIRCSVSASPGSIFSYYAHLIISCDSSNYPIQ
jgi:hypothetical protein